MDMPMEREEGFVLSAKRRVIFGDTDAMGIVYYGDYLRYFEVGRVELLRRAGIVYRNLVERGIHLPVIDVRCRYLNPARYDDEISIYAKVEKVDGVRLSFAYLIERDGLTIAEGYTEHAFTNEKGKPVRPPEDLKKRLEELKSGE